MIQILGLRSFVTKEGEKVTYDKLFDIKTDVDTVKELFEKHEEILGKIKKSERWNLFYTVSNCGEGKREFEATNTIAFDIDKIKVEEYQRYIDPVCSTLKVKKDALGIVLSGNGLHFLLHLNKPIQKKNWFKENKAHYTAVCSKINEAIANAGLPGEADTAIFEPRRILRLPGTTNRKPDKQDKLCTLLQPIAKGLRFKLSDISGIPLVATDEQLDKGLLKRYPDTDPPAVLNGCEFLKFCHESPNDIDEPAWYAALSITARLDGQGSSGWERSHELSKGHSGYSSEVTDQKILQALEASGPRTCASIQGLWGRCTECPHWGKLGSPILIRGDGSIRTEGTGFHLVIPGGNKPDKYIPMYGDLLKYYDKHHLYKNLAGSKITYLWNGTHYERVEKAHIQNFAHQHFTRGDGWVAPNKMVEEFYGLVTRTNLYPVDWWEESTARKMNFLNGYLDIDSMVFRPTDPELGFRHVLPYEYDPNATAPVFDAMMKRVTNGDQELIDVLLEFMGYSMSNDRCWSPRVLVLTGEGKNGKSTFVDTLKYLAGDNNFSAIPMEKIDDPYNLAVLDGKLFNICEEATTKAFKHNRTFKNLAAGATFTVRQIYKEPYQMTNRAKLILTCNTLPENIDQTSGFYRRLIIAPFTVEMDKTRADYDPHIKDKLTKELPGIFNKAMEGYKRLVKQADFSGSKNVKSTMDEYRIENDTVLYWAKEYLNIHVNGGFEDNFASILTLYEAYKTVMKMAELHAENYHVFQKRLAKLQGDVWGQYSYQDRTIRKYVEVAGKKERVRGLRGVSIPQVN